MDDMWACESCYSVNRANDARCYKCHTPRVALARAEQAERNADKKGLPWTWIGIACAFLITAGALGTLTVLQVRKPLQTPSSVSGIPLGSSGAVTPSPAETATLDLDPTMTDTPTPTPTPSPTPSPSPAPPTPKPIPPKATANIYTIVMAYQGSVYATYSPSYFSTLTNFAYHGGCLVDGATPEECQAWIDYYKQATSPILSAFQQHLDYLSNNPAPACLVDAYAADSGVTNSVIQWISIPRTSGGEGTPEGRETIVEFNALLASVNRFEESLPSYVADCG